LSHVLLSANGSTVVVALLLANFMVFNSTKSTLDPDGDSDDDTIWGTPGQTELWPSIVLLCVASVSTFLSIGLSTYSPLSNRPVVLISYIGSVKWANRLATAHASLTIGTSIFLMVVWGASVGIFNIHKQASGSTDLWSWSCQVEKEDGAAYGGVNWAQFCKMQVSRLG